MSQLTLPLDLTQYKIEKGAEIKAGKSVLYLTKEHGCYEVSDFYGIFKFTVYKIHHSTRHNIGRYRHDAWFKDREGNWWHGVSYGFNTTLIYCRRIKRKSRRM